MYEIIFYEDAHGNCPVGDFISKLDQNVEKSKNARIQLKQIMFQIDLLELRGTRCPEEYVDHIRNEIWELRPGNNRILFFTWKNNKIVLLHSFRKTTGKTPQREIAKAEREIKDWVTRNGL